MKEQETLVERKELERDLTFLLEVTLKMEDELNSFVKMED